MLKKREDNGMEGWQTCVDGEVLSDHSSWTSAVYRWMMENRIWIWMRPSTAKADSV